MFYRNILHAIGLHMHQPPGNLELLIDSNPGEAEQIIRCYERTARHAARFPDTAISSIYRPCWRATDGPKTSN
jgi:hypothetical protein